MAGGARTARPKPRPENQRDTRQRFEQWANNPGCEANTLSAVHNVKMAAVAKHLGIDPSFGASPFALARGEQFEFNLLRDGAARLIPELERTEVLPEGSTELADLRIRMNRGSDPHLVDLDTACDRTLDLLREVGAARGAAVAKLPAVVAAASVKLPRGVMLPEALLIIDVLAVRPLAGSDRAEIVVGEVKTYPDRGGHTDRRQLAGARAQMGLYLHALRAVIADFPDAERPVLADHGFLVLSRPGSDFPRVRAGEDLRFQAARAARGFDLLEEAAALLSPVAEADEGEATATAHLDAVLAADTEYAEACLSFCDLAPRCHRAALSSHDPSVLGDAVAQFVGRISLERIGELFDGAAPADTTERELLDRIRAAEEPGWD